MKEQVTIFIWFFFGLLYPTWKNFSEKIFLNDFLSCFEWKYCAVSQNVICMSFIYLHFSNCKFLAFCSIDWFSFQKALAIGPFRIRRCQDFWDKSLVWFLGFQSTLPPTDAMSCIPAGFLPADMSHSPQTSVHQLDTGKGDRHTNTGDRHTDIGDRHTSTGDMHTNIGDRHTCC